MRCSRVQSVVFPLFSLPRKTRNWVMLHWPGRHVAVQQPLVSSAGVGANIVCCLVWHNSAMRCSSLSNRLMHTGSLQQQSTMNTASGVIYSNGCNCPSSSPHNGECRSSYPCDSCFSRALQISAVIPSARRNPLDAVSRTCPCTGCAQPSAAGKSRSPTEPCSAAAGCMVTLFSSLQRPSSLWST
jgi:hypothetical protein